MAKINTRVVKHTIFSTECACAPGIFKLNYSKNETSKKETLFRVFNLFRLYPVLQNTPYNFQNKFHFPFEIILFDFA